MSTPIVLEGLRTKSKITLPVSKAEVEVWDYAIVGDVSGSIKIVDNTPEIGDPLRAVVGLIASWPFTDPDGNPLEINEENLRKLPVPDFVVIAKKVEEATKNAVLTTEEKKSTQVSST